MADLALLSLFAGLYSVPMYALIQLRSQPTHRARIIAANNILNALFMIASSVHRRRAARAPASRSRRSSCSPACQRGGGVLHLHAGARVPAALRRLGRSRASSTASRCAATSTSRPQGAAILVCNHVSFVDAVLLMAASPRPIRFIMDHRIFRMPVLGWLFRLAKAIPIAPQRRRPGDLRAGLRARRAGAATTATCCASFPKAGSPATASCGSSRAA